MIQNLADPIQFSGRSVLSSMFHESSIFSLPNCPNRCLFASRRQHILTEMGLTTLSARTIVLWARHGGDNSIFQTHSRILPLLPQRLERLQLRLLVAKSHPLRSVNCHPRLEHRVVLRVESLDSLVASGLTLCVTIFSCGTICGRNDERFLQLC